MSGIGHLAVGLAAKSATDKVPLWLLLAASETNDLLYFLFTASGIEQKAAIVINFNQGIRYLTPVSNPWSHGFLMSVIWSILAAALAYIFYRDRHSAVIIGSVVFSHWILDFLMHSNLPLSLNGSPLIGLGLENSGAGFIFMTLLDISLVICSITIYMVTRKKAGANTLAKQQ
jgi:hypothetical protein